MGIVKKQVLQENAVNGMKISIVSFRLERFISTILVYGFFGCYARFDMGHNAVLPLNHPISQFLTPKITIQCDFRHPDRDWNLCLL